MDRSDSVLFRVLGPVSADRDGASLDLGSPQQRLALGLLLARFGAPVSIDQLIDEIWGAAPPSTARKTLQVYVSHLRTTLGEGCIETGLGTYRVVGGGLDARDFEAMTARGRSLTMEDPQGSADLLASALGLWMGPPYAGLESCDALVAEIGRLEELRIAALEDRIAADLEAGGASALIGELESLTREYPWRERLRGQLMVALYRAGRQADALLVFRRTREQLVEELGVEPGPDLQELQLQILQHDDALLARARQASRRPIRAIRGYELREEVVRAAGARLYRAFDRGSGSLVAVKAIAAEAAASEGFLDRFEATGELLARLSHPAIVPLADFWREPEGAFLVSPWASDGSLRSSMSGGRPLAPETALELVGDIGSALAYAHRNGVVHGAVKPENVLAQDTGGWALADFPILPPATGRYVAPEVQRPADATPAADIYGFGLLIHEVLTGSLPEAGRPSRLLLPELQEAIARATATDPGRRQPRVEEVVRAVRTATGSDVVAVAGIEAGQPARARNPFKGLRAFLETDARDFHGREDAVRELLARAAEHRLVAVVGPSGSGKSSLVRAGFMPALRRELGRRALVTEMFPGAYPFEQLETALRRVAVDWPAQGAMSELTADEGGLLRLVQAVLPPDGELVLVIDQFEELFSLLEDPAARRRFIGSLAAAVEADDSRIRLVITLRADFFDRPLEYPVFGGLLRDGVVPLATLSASQLALAISEPAAGAGLDLEPGFVSQIVSDAADQPGALPLVQFALAEAVERSDGRRLTLEAYRRTGGVGGALARRAEEVFGQQGEAGRRALQQAFLRLVHVGDEGVGTRRRVRIAELSSLDIDQQALAAALQAFAAHRLLIFDRDPITRGATVEVAHEALLSRWPRLRAWIDGRREDLLLRDRLAAAHAEWVASGSDEAFLLAGRRLAQFAGWEATTGLKLTAEEAGFIARSRAMQASRDRRGRRIRIGISGAIAALLLFGAGLGLVAVQAGSTARHEELQRLARAALVDVPQDPEQAVLVALAAADMSRALDGSVTDQVLEAIHAGLMQMRVEATIPRGGLIALDARDDLLVIGDPPTASASGVTLWNAATTRMLGVLPGSGSIRALALRPDSDLLYGIDPQGNLHTWHLPDGRATVRSLPVAPSASGSWFMAISPDGGLIAVGNDTGDAVTVAETNTGRSVRLAVGSPTYAGFSPDGAQLAVGTVGGEVTFYDVAGWQRTATWSMPEGTRVNQLAWSPGSDRLAIATESAGAMIWSRAQGIKIQTMPGYFAESVRFDAAGRRVVIGNTDGTGEVVDAQTGAVLAQLGGHHLGIGGVAFTPDGDRAITTSDDDTTRLWDLTASGQHELRTLQATSGGRSGNLDFSDDGSLLATQSQIGEARVWSTATWQPVSPVITGLPTLAGQISLSPDGSTVAVAQGTTPGDVATIRDPRLRTIPTGTGIFDTHTGELLKLLPGVRGHTVERAYTPDGRRLVTTSLGGVITIYDLTDYHVLDSAESAHGAMNLVSFDPQGTRLVVGNQDGTFSIWRIGADGTLDLAQTVHVHSGGFVFARMSPDGSRIATGSEDGTARIWDANGTLLRELEGHTAMIWNLAWSPGGDTLVTVSLDGTIRIWDPRSGALRMTLTTVGIPASAEIAPDNTLAVAAGSSGLVYLYTLDPDRLVGLAEQRTTRSLSAGECRYFGITPCPSTSGAPGS